MQTSTEFRKYLFVLIGVYVGLTLFVDFWIGLCAPGGFYWSFAEQHLNFVKWYREVLIAGAQGLCSLFGLQTLSNSTSMLIIGHGKVNIVYSCVGFGMLSLITALGTAIPYKTIKQRITYIILMFIGFTALNICRISFIAYYAKAAKNFGIDHHLIFNIICYLLIAAISYVWIRKPKYA